MLDVRDIRVSYNGVPALHSVSFHVEAGEIVSIVGANGAGKSTILRTLSGLLRPDAGEITFLGQRIDGLPAHRIVKLGLAHVPEGRLLFAHMPVERNLRLGAYVHKSPEVRQATQKRIYDIFPVLKERLNQRAGTLSGGEQQMLAIARGLMSQPQLLMLDEPSLGLMPTLVDRIFEIVHEIREEGMTILLVEQNVREALELADRAYVLQTGRVVLEGTGLELLESDLVQKAYLGL